MARGGGDGQRCRRGTIVRTPTNQETPSCESLHEMGYSEIDAAAWVLTGDAVVSLVCAR